MHDLAVVDLDRAEPGPSTAGGGSSSAGESRKSSCSIRTPRRPLGVHQLLQVQPEELHQPADLDAHRLDRGRVQAQLALGREGQVAQHGERDAVHQAVLPQLAVVDGDASSLPERRAGIGEGVAVEQPAQRGRRDPDAGGVDAEGEGALVVEVRRGSGDGAAELAAEEADGRARWWSPRGRRHSASAPGPGARPAPARPARAGTARRRDAGHPDPHQARMPVRMRAPPVGFRAI